MSLKNKCLGCGAILQDNNPKLVGYTSKLTNDYCQRCFRLSHYGDLTNYHHDTYNNKVVKIIKEHKNALLIYIVDAYEAFDLINDSFLASLKNNNVLLIINKIDLIPSNITEKRLDDIYSSILVEVTKKYHNIIDALLTYKNDSSFNDLFFSLLEENDFKELVFIGKTNVGKSSLLNKLSLNNNLTTSIYPGTTVDEVSLSVRGYNFIDTPGLEDSDNLLSYMPIELINDYLAFKSIKNLVFQVYSPQSYFMSGLFSLTYTPTNKGSIIFYSFRDDIHRTKAVNHDYFANTKKFKYDLKPWNDHEYFIKDKKCFLIKGFGFIKIVGRGKVNIKINDKIKIHESEVLL